jgi:hypothetical protein
LRNTHVSFAPEESLYDAGSERWQHLTPEDRELAMHQLAVNYAARRWPTQYRRRSDPPDPRIMRAEQDAARRQRISDTLTWRGLRDRARQGAAALRALAITQVAPHDGEEAADGPGRPRAPEYARGGAQMTAPEAAGAVAAPQPGHV